MKKVLDKALFLYYNVFVKWLGVWIRINFLGDKIWQILKLKL